VTPLILLATRGAGKLRELRHLFASRGLDAIDLTGAGIPEEPAEALLERYATFEENALAKARHFFERSGGLPTVADDSGLVVEALGGRPGVLSKRWSERPDLSGQALDDANNRTLLRALANEVNRRASYVCAAAYVDSARAVARRGEVAGEILLSPRGAGGFGYDPYFRADELGRTFAEVSLDEKERVSHRGRAFAELLREVIAVG
jgi:XTP/dITP diphosphohydrolase